MNCIRSRRRVPSCACVQLTAMERILTNEEIDTICEQLGYTWRNRVFPPAVTVRSMVYRSLHRDRSIKGVLADLAAAGDGRVTAPTDSAWCQARSRLPDGLWPQLIEQSVSRASALAGDQFLYAGRPVYFGDGSTVSMPDTPELVKAFGYAKTKHGPSRFPVARITFIVRAGVEVVCDYRLGPYRNGEDAQLHSMWHRIPCGSIIIWDRLFCSFYNLAKCQHREVDVITRLHQRRDPNKLIANGKRVGKHEWLVRLSLGPQLRKQYNDPSLPQYLDARLIRIVFYRKGRRREIWLVTTLLDPKQDNRGHIIRLYRRRWCIETRIGHLKTSLQMNVLRSQTLVGVRSEVAATILAHNLTSTIIHQAARRSRRSAARISFAGAVRTILAFSAALRTAAGAARRRLYRHMLTCIASDPNPYRPGRVEPRLIKRDPVRYEFLKIPRDEARQLCLS